MNAAVSNKSALHAGALAGRVACDTCAKSCKDAKGCSVGFIKYNEPLRADKEDICSTFTWKCGEAEGYTPCTKFAAKDDKCDYCIEKGRGTCGKKCKKTCCKRSVREMFPLR